MREPKNYDILNDPERHAETVERKRRDYSELKPPVEPQEEIQPQRPEERRIAERARVAETARPSGADKPIFENLEDKYAHELQEKRTNIAERLATGRITPTEAVDEERRFENQQESFRQSEEAYAESRERHNQKTNELAKEHTKTLVQQSEELRQVGGRIEAYGQEPGGGEAKPLSQNPSHEEARYAKALAEQHSARDPFGSLGRAAGAEYAAFSREQQVLSEQIAREFDLTKRNELAMRQDIRAADYLAFTSRRIVQQEEMITGSRDTEIGLKYSERAAEQEARSKALNERYEELNGHEAWTSAQEEQQASYERSLETARRSEAEQSLTADTPPSTGKGDNERTEIPDAARAKSDKREAEGEAPVNEWREAAKGITGRGMAG